MSGPRAVLAVAAFVLTTVLAAPAWAGGGHGDDARHSLRAPVTGESFYFVMADRFENGSTANDEGGLPGHGRGRVRLRPQRHAAGTTAAT